MPHKILVVDDEPDLELLIKQKFRKQIRDQELHFEFAQNGIQALERLGEHADITVVLSDINMPEMDGRTVVKVIDHETKDVVRQIPAEEILEVARRVAEQNDQKGNLFKVEV